jgi:hypothetical protein
MRVVPVRDSTGRAAAIFNCPVDAMFWPPRPRAMETAQTGMCTGSAESVHVSQFLQQRLEQETSHLEGEFDESTAGSLHHRVVPVTIEDQLAEDVPNGTQFGDTRPSLLCWSN